MQMLITLNGWTLWSSGPLLPLTVFLRSSYTLRTLWLWLTPFQQLLGLKTESFWLEFALNVKTWRGETGLMRQLRSLIQSEAEGTLVTIKKKKTATHILWVCGLNLLPRPCPLSVQRKRVLEQCSEEKLIGWSDLLGPSVVDLGLLCFCFLVQHSFSSFMWADRWKSLKKGRRAAVWTVSMPVMIFS